MNDPPFFLHIGMASALILGALASGQAARQNSLSERQLLYSTHEILRGR